MDETIIASYFRCPACRGPQLQTIPFERSGKALVNAVVSCKSCRTWYRLEDGLLELLVPALRDKEAETAFRRRFASHWDGWSGASGHVERSDRSHDGHKFEQTGFFDKTAVRYETSMIRQP